MGTVVKNSVSETTVKISVYNGDTKLSFGYKQQTDLLDEQTAKNYIFDSLQKIVDSQNKLKALGAKSNFFGLSEYKENQINIDIVTENGTETFMAGLSFKFSQFKKVENKREAFDIIFDTKAFLVKQGATLVVQ